MAEEVYATLWDLNAKKKELAALLAEAKMLREEIQELSKQLKYKAH